jgi:cobalt-precorrin 5A hydrolase
MSVIGVGCRQGSACDEVLGAVDAVLARYGVAKSSIRALASVPLKADEPGLVAAARTLGLPLLVPDAVQLAQADARCLTRSAASMAATGLGSACEAAALAACGPGATLLGPRIIHHAITCAIASGAQP